MFEEKDCVLFRVFIHGQHRKSQTTEVTK